MMRALSRGTVPMRIVVITGLFLLAAIWLSSGRVVAQSAAEQAESLESALQAVEWYTNESVRKALQAEADGDMANADLFGQKAIESDKKAAGLRQQAADAWLQAGKPDRARDAWDRAADMARERAELLGNRIMTLQQRWQSGQQDQGRVLSPQEREIIRLQGLFLTAQQWYLVSDFYRKAEEPEQVAKAQAEVRSLLPALVKDERLRALASDPRLAGAHEQVTAWQQELQSAAR